MFDIRFYLYLSILALSVCMGSWRFNRLRLPFQLLVIFILLTLLGELYDRVICMPSQQNTLGGAPYYHFHVIYEYVFWVFVYYHITLKKYTWGSLWLIGSIAVVGLFNLYNTAYLQPLKIVALPTNGILVSIVCILLMAMLTYTRFLTDVSRKGILKQSVFWLNTAVVLFYTINFFIFAFFKSYMMRSDYSMTMLNILYHSNNIMYILLGISIVVEMRYHTPSQSDVKDVFFQEKP